VVGTLDDVQHAPADRTLERDGLQQRLGDRLDVLPVGVPLALEHNLVVALGVGRDHRRAGHLVLAHDGERVARPRQGGFRDGH